MEKISSTGQKLKFGLVCPNCSNALTISRTEPTAGYPQGVNRWECRVCPYEKLIDELYKETIPMKQKEVEGVFSDMEVLRNADKHRGENIFPVYA
jgi:DNA-directed RNA polymerase III subunit RPC11